MLESIQSCEVNVVVSRRLQSQNHLNSSVRSLTQEPIFKRSTQIATPHWLSHSQHWLLIGWKTRCGLENVVFKVGTELSKHIFFSEKSLDNWSKFYQEWSAEKRHIISTQLSILSTIFKSILSQIIGNHLLIFVSENLAERIFMTSPCFTPGALWFL